MPLYPCLIGYNSIVCCGIEHIDHFQPHTNFPAQSLHFRFGSVAPCPTLKPNVTISVPRTRYRRLARPYLIGFFFPIVWLSAYQSVQNFFRSLGEINYADFTARTYKYYTIYHKKHKWKRVLFFQIWEVIFDFFYRIKNPTSNHNFCSCLFSNLSCSSMTTR